MSEQRENEEESCARRGGRESFHSERGRVAA